MGAPFFGHRVFRDQGRRTAVYLTHRSEGRGEGRGCWGEGATLKARKRTNGCQDRSEIEATQPARDGRDRAGAAPRLLLCDGPDQRADPPAIRRGGNLLER